MTTTPPAATIGRAPHTFPTARRLTTRLAAPAPGWTLSGDVIVVGSGIAGLATAIHAHRAGHRVLVVTKSLVNAGSTAWAQGGIAAALADDDSPAEHRVDTLVAGAGLCDPQAVDVLVTEGPQAIGDLVRWGTEFDRDAAGELELTREGGHLRRRIAHAGGDATGAEISRAMVAAVATPNSCSAWRWRSMARPAFMRWPPTRTASMAAKTMPGLSSHPIRWPGRGRLGWTCALVWPITMPGPVFPGWAICWSPARPAPTSTTSAA